MVDKKENDSMELEPEFVAALNKVVAAAEDGKLEAIPLSEANKNWPELRAVGNRYASEVEAKARRLDN